MKRVLALAVLCCLSSLAHARQDFEGQELMDSWRTGARSLPPAQAQTYARGRYTFASDAETARMEAETNLRNAGIAVMDSRITEEYDSYGFRIDFVAPPDFPTPMVQTYTGGDYTFQSDGTSDLAQAVEKLERMGYRVLLGEIRKNVFYPSHYYCQVDYFAVPRRTRAPRRR